MRHLFMGLIGLALVGLGAPASALALPISGSYDYSYHTNYNTALGIEVDNLNGSGSLDNTRTSGLTDWLFGERTFGFNLAAGQEKSFDMFEIWTNQGSINSLTGNDTHEKAFKITFDLGDLGIHTATGKTFASASSDGRAQGNLIWDNDGVFDFGTHNGDILTLSLNDATFNTGTATKCLQGNIFNCRKTGPDPLDLNGGSWYSALVRGTFALNQAPVVDPLPQPTPVSEPATLALLGMGAAGVAFTRRRKSA